MAFNKHFLAWNRCLGKGGGRKRPTKQLTKLHTGECCMLLLLYVVVFVVWLVTAYRLIPLVLVVQVLLVLDDFWGGFIRAPGNGPPSEREPTSSVSERRNKRLLNEKRAKKEEALDNEGRRPPVQQCNSIQSIHYNNLKDRTHTFCTKC